MIFNGNSPLKNAPLFLSFLIFFFLLTSCVNTKNTTYFNNQADAIIASSSKVPETIIQPKDILAISVSSLNPAASNIFNSANTSFNTTVNSSQGNQTLGYLVDSSGDIEFPILGKIHAQDKTSNQLRLEIVNQLTTKNLLVDPVVSVRYLNYHITVLGEVAHPSVLNIPSEKISLLEALGLAGDITIYGRKDNVLIIRETDQGKIIKRIDLNSSDLFTSPYYYLKSNDILYVEANKARVATSKQSTYLIPILLSALSFVAIIVSDVIRNNN